MIVPGLYSRPDLERSLEDVPHLSKVVIVPRMMGEPFLLPTTPAFTAPTVHVAGGALARIGVATGHSALVDHPAEAPVHDRPVEAEDRISARRKQPPEISPCRGDQQGEWDGPQPRTGRHAPPSLILAPLSERPAVQPRELELLGADLVKDERPWKVDGREPGPFKPDGEVRL